MTATATPARPESRQSRRSEDELELIRAATSKHARLLVRLLARLSQAVEVLNELEDAGPDDCPEELFEAECGPSPEAFWERILAGVRFSVEGCHRMLAMDLGSAAILKAAALHLSAKGVNALDIKSRS